MTSELTDQEIMGDRLIKMRKNVLRFLQIKYKLSEHDAEDVYSEVTLYLLERGADRIDLYQNFDGAIVNLAKLRALNHLRQNKRYVHGWFHTWEAWGKFASGDGPEVWDSKIDGELLAQDVVNCVKPQHKPIIKSIIRGDTINEAARKHDINKNTLHTFWKRIRRRMKEQYEQEEV